MLLLGESVGSHISQTAEAHYVVHSGISRCFYLVSVDVGGDGFGEEVRAHSSSLQVKVQSCRVLIGHYIGRNESCYSSCRWLCLKMLS